jgi:hypothetical protein
MVSEAYSTLCLGSIETELPFLSFWRLQHNMNFRVLFSVLFPLFFSLCFSPFVLFWFFSYEFLLQVRKQQEDSAMILASRCKWSFKVHLILFVFPLFFVFCVSVLVSPLLFSLCFPFCVVLLLVAS